MPDPELLLQRLDQIGASLETLPAALALIALGSTGQEQQRLDPYSDLDFFVLVAPGAKNAFIHNLGWLSAACPIAYHFQNTPDGYKLLFADGVFCEFAVFEPAELTTVPFVPGRVAWKRPEVDPDICIPAAKTTPPAPRPLDWLLGEALTNLYVGLCRFQRGERLSAARFIQGYAIDRLVELSTFIEKPQLIPPDPFTPERRCEQRCPLLAQELPELIQGYARSPHSARAILAYLERHFSLDPAMKGAILALCAPDLPPPE
ncbi:MAG: hypothetical protein AB1894_10530 [Chloroflexota bacterium]